MDLLSVLCPSLYCFWHYLPFPSPPYAFGFKQVQNKEYICWIQVKTHISDQTSLRICNSVYEKDIDGRHQVHIKFCCCVSHLSYVLEVTFVTKPPGLELKGQCHEIFCLWFFYESVSPQPQSVPLGRFRIFSKRARRYWQLKVDHRCRWHRWQMKKIFNQKNFNNFVGTPLDCRVNIYINFCLQVHFKVSSAWY